MVASHLDKRPSIILRSLDHLFLLRPLILVPVWTFFLLGAWHSGHSGDLWSGRFIPGIIAFTMLTGAIYIINQISDRESDLDNDKLFFIPESIISVRTASVEASVLIIISLAISFTWLPAGFTLISFAGLLLGIIYSVEPVRLKKRPLFDVLANAVGNGILNTLAGWIAVGGELKGLIILLPYPFAVASVHLVTTLADIEGDRKSSLRTSGIALGVKKGLIFSTILMAAAAVLAVISSNREALYATLLSLPAFLVPMRSENARLSRSNILIPAKLSTLVFSVVAGFLFRLYIPFLLIIVIATRIYYRRRFRLDYPSM
ncbi:MAG: UbiA family prenyltransferase [Candidatus Krumholzibacteriota bacterium]|nr:UbiA family prenyltransferase [Candidatus Krumholzibacteriota bacterium]